MMNADSVKKIQKLERIKSFFDKHKTRLEKLIDDQDSKDVIFNQFTADIESLKIDRKIIEEQNRPLNIAITGIWNSGKSTLINSIIGEELLGMDVCPATSKVTILKYGDTRRIEKVCFDGNFEEISDIEYKEYSVHKYDSVCKINPPPDDFDSIDYFVIYYPSEVLRDINIFDTPGFASLNDEDEKETIRGCENVDVVLWICKADTGIGEDDIECIKKIVNEKPFCVIMNRIDEIPGVDSPDNQCLNEKKEEDVVRPLSNNDIKPLSIEYYQAEEIKDYVVSIRKRKDIFESFIERLKENNNSHFSLMFYGNKIAIGSWKKEDIDIETLPPIVHTQFLSLREGLLKRLKEVKGKKDDYLKRTLNNKTNLIEYMYRKVCERIIAKLKDKREVFNRQTKVQLDGFDLQKDNLIKGLNNEYSRVKGSLLSNLFPVWCIPHKSRKFRFLLNDHNISITKERIKTAFDEYTNTINSYFKSITDSYQSDIGEYAVDITDHHILDEMIKLLIEFCNDSFISLIKFNIIVCNNSDIIDFGLDKEIDVKDIILKLVPDEVLHKQLKYYYEGKMKDLKSLLEQSLKEKERCVEELINDLNTIIND